MPGEFLVLEIQFYLYFSICICYTISLWQLHGRDPCGAARQHPLVAERGLLVPGGPGRRQAGRQPRQRRHRGRPRARQPRLGPQQRVAAAEHPSRSGAFSLPFLLYLYTSNMIMTSVLAPQVPSQPQGVRRPRAEAAAARWRAAPGPAASRPPPRPPASPSTS